jgi:type VI secretion system secreted protein Hcp
MRSIFTAYALAAAFTVAVPAAHAGQDIFLKIEGIKGESQDRQHPDEIVVVSFEHGGQQGSVGGTSGGGSGKVRLGELVVKKQVDSASAPLFLALASGRHIPKAILTVRRSGKVPVEILKITLTDVMVSSLKHGATTTSDSEEISLNFAKIELDYKPVKSDGAPGTLIKAGWDLKANRPVN